MEVKINREIRNYTESMFFGLSLRQCVFSVLAIAVAVGLYFLLRPYFGLETLSWVCVLGAAPFAALGFITYHGMTAEQFLWAWLRSELLEPKQLKCEPQNLYYELLKGGKDVKNPKQPAEAGKRALRRPPPGAGCDPHPPRLEGRRFFVRQPVHQDLPVYGHQLPGGQPGGQGSMFLSYSELLNSLDSGASAKLTINNRRLNKAHFEDSILMPLRGDFRDEYRKEYNQMLLDKATGANGIMQEKYLTLSVAKKNVEEARSYFARVGADLTAHFAALGSKCKELDASERLRILHDFYRPGEEDAFHFDLNQSARLGHSFKDAICPDSVERFADHLKLGDKYCRVLYLKEYANYIKDEMVNELTDLNRNLMLSIDILPVPTDEAVREVENRLLGVETNITNWQRRQNQNNNFSAVIPYDMELQRKESKEFLNDLTTRDQRMMLCVLTLVIMADSYQQLQSDTESIQAVARKQMCQMAVLKFQQMDGLNTALPIGVRKINAFRTLTTESLAVFMPFKVQEIQDKGGIYFGENAISHNLLLCNKGNLLNQSAFQLGVPGSGKSFLSKEQIAFLILNTEDDVLICDPENEFGPLCQTLGQGGRHSDPHGRRRERPLKRHVHGGGLRGTEPHCGEKPVCHVPHRADRPAGRGAPAQIHHRPVHRLCVPGGRENGQARHPLRPAPKAAGAAGGESPGHRPVLGAVHHRLLGHLRQGEHCGLGQAHCGVRHPQPGGAAEAHGPAGHHRHHPQPGHPQLEAGQTHPCLHR